MSRRRFLVSAAGVAAAAWMPVGLRPLAAASQGESPPAGFPPEVPLFQRVFENWAKEIHVEGLWTCRPRSGEDVVAVANWAHREGYRLRPVGMMHNWSPLAVSGDDASARLVLVDTRGLSQMALAEGFPASAVAVGTGATMEELLTFLETRGLGMTSVPAPGDVTVGGVLAIGGHGAAVPASGEARVPGHGYGSVSNLVLSITYVAWDEDDQTYALRTIGRGHPLAGPLLVSLGRAFITEVTLQVGPNHNLRCQSFTDIPASEIFAAPGASGRTFSSFLESAGRVEAIWYSHTDKPWLKVWSVAPTKPLTSREVSEPYNYPFSDNVPDELAALAHELVTSNPSSAPLFGQSMYGVTAAGLVATASLDIWGPSKNTLLYIKPTTLRVHANGYAVVTNRSNVQRVLHDFTEFYGALVADYEKDGKYPANMALEIRVSGLDVSDDLTWAQRSSPAPAALSSLGSVAGTQWDVAVWINLLTLPGTAHSAEMYERVEAWLFERFSPPEALVRPEWSKGWAYTSESGAWAADRIIEQLPALYPAYATAWERLRDADPEGVFTSDLIERVAQ